MKLIVLLLLFASALGAQSTFVDHLNRGKALAAQHQWSAARTEFQQAIGEAAVDKTTHESPQSAAAAYRIAQTFREEGKIDSAIDWYTQSLTYHATAPASEERIQLELQRLGRPLPANAIKAAFDRPPTEKSAIAEADSGNSIELEVLFAFDESTLSPEGRQQVHELGLAMTSADYKGRKFRIVGHTDDQGKEDYNQRLSEQRARVVATSLLKEFGDLGNRLDFKGAGMNNPKYPNNSEETRRLNRRVQVTLLD